MKIEDFHIDIFDYLAIVADPKRKEILEQHEKIIGSTNNSNLEYEREIIETLDEGENDPNRRCVDLIVLGISYRSVEADVKKCFEVFGELIFCEVKKNQQEFRIDY